MFFCPTSQCFCHCRSESEPTVDLNQSPLSIWIGADVSSLVFDVKVMVAVSDLVVVFLLSDVDAFALSSCVTRSAVETSVVAFADRAA
eukprot:2266938-Rhodomonas_salina.1